MGGGGRRSSGRSGRSAGEAAAAPPAGRGRDSDTALRARILHALAWALFPGLFMGAAIGHARGLLAGVLALFAITGFVAGAGLLASEVAGRVAAGLVHPPCGPVRSDHSRARALVSAGRLEDARLELEAAAAEDPGDPVPCVELARLYRDGLRRPEDALSWFRRAKGTAGTAAGDERVVMREIVELARGPLGDPSRAAPDLARHAEAFAGTAEGDWARDELGRIKAEMLERAEADRREPSA